MNGGKIWGNQQVRDFLHVQKILITKLTKLSINKIKEVNHSKMIGSPFKVAVCQIKGSTYSQNCRIFLGQVFQNIHRKHTHLCSGLFRVVHKTFRSCHHFQCKATEAGNSSEIDVSKLISCMLSVIYVMKKQ